ncbi:MAG TPA: phage major capsid protein [Candidatus Acidoferrales bacterium]|nr:phage major capsid protein [Candidatus Acidoferrales bacterium]
MANLSDIQAVTVNYVSDTFVDNFFKVSPTFVKVWKGGEMAKPYPGGVQIQAPFQYAPLKAGPFAPGGVFDISYVQTQTAMLFNPKFSYANVTVRRTDLAINRGWPAVMNFLEPKVVNAEQALAQTLITQFFEDGQGTVSPLIALDGILAGYDDGTNYPTYGGITRSSVGTGASAGINGYYFNNSGTTWPFSLQQLQTAFGQATFGPNQPNFIATTQSIYNSFWAKMLPMQRTMEIDPDLQGAGFRAFRFNGMSVVVDQYCPSGYIFGMNTDYIDAYVSEDPAFNFGFTGWKELPNSLDMAAQTVFGGNIVVTAPRLGFILASVS